MLHPFAQDVGSVVPPVFGAYARVFHPAQLGEWDVRWADIALVNGRAAHARMQFENLTDVPWDVDGEQPGLWDRKPRVGVLPAPPVAVLVDVLRRHTTTPNDCTFAVWEGWGGAVPSGSVLRLPGRAYVLSDGPVDAVPEKANLWWPADRAWCVATEIDFDSTYVGGSAQCIADLVADRRIEAMATAADDPIGAAADDLNPRRAQS